MPIIGSTLRLQFHKGFTFTDAIPLIHYFKQLGITHIYSSPIFKARAGSIHGYDVVDPTLVNPELGGEEAFRKLVEELRKQDMGIIVDIVSNHMAVTGNDNPWWTDVMRWGLKSPYAHFFDIQWNSPDPLLKGQLLLPFLRTHYGEVLAANEISLQFDKDSGEFYAQHFDHRFPLYPPSYSHILRQTHHGSLLALADWFDALEHSVTGWREAQMLHEQLKKIAAESTIMEEITHALALYDVSQYQPKHQQFYDEEPDNAEHAGDIHPEWQDNKNLQRLHQLLEQQQYRLASWRTAGDDINWRRFFDVSELGGLRTERAEVFEASHAKIFALVEEGLIDGLRIDHVDGLANPRAYCRKLRRRIDYLTTLRPPQFAQQHFPIYVEKILGPTETLCGNWSVDGTTGYEFMNQVTLLSHDSRGESPLKEFWQITSGRPYSFEDEMVQARQFVLSSTLAGDVETVAHGLLSIARTDIATRDFTLGAIRRTLVELIAHFPVYRTYANACARSPEDQRFFALAIAGARTTLPEIDWPLLDYLDRWLGGVPLFTYPPGPARKLRQKVLARFQQLTSPAAAKAVEDTACYRSVVLLSRNDVGFDPQKFCASPQEFHDFNQQQQRKFPQTLLTTATHDHKRGEDTRARLAVLSERAPWFIEQVQKWQVLAAPLLEDMADGRAPSPADEYILYQNLVGSWPLDLELDDAAGIKGYLDRLLRWQEKALREAKLRSHWNTPNEDYEATCQSFLTTILTAKNSQELRAHIFAAANAIAPAGALNSLTQTLLRMTAPGVPDLYQGSEFWDFSFVDPDNRNPVDFAARQQALEKYNRLDDIIQSWRNGGIKLWQIANTLKIRKQHNDLFARGDYQPLVVEGAQADNIVAFIRRHESQVLVVIVPRLAADLLADGNSPLVPPSRWSDTKVVLPAELLGATLQTSLAPTPVNSATTHLAIGEILQNFPVNFLLFNLAEGKINNI